MPNVWDKLVLTQCRKGTSTGPVVAGCELIKKKCVFPFNWKGVTYTACTREEDDIGREWCSTAVDANNEHLDGQGEWGYCEKVVEEVSEGILEEVSEGILEGFPLWYLWFLVPLLLLLILSVLLCLYCCCYRKKHIWCEEGKSRPRKAGGAKGYSDLMVFSGHTHPTQNAKPHKPKSKSNKNKSDKGGTSGAYGLNEKDGGGSLSLGGKSNAPGDARRVSMDHYSTREKTGARSLSLGRARRDHGSGKSKSHSQGESLKERNGSSAPSLTRRSALPSRMGGPFSHSVGDAVKEKKGSSPISLGGRRKPTSQSGMEPKPSKDAQYTEFNGGLNVPSMHLLRGKTRTKSSGDKSKPVSTPEKNRAVSSAIALNSISAPNAPSLLHMSMKSRKPSQEPGKNMGISNAAYLKSVAGSSSPDIHLSQFSFPKKKV